MSLRDQLMALSQSRDCRCWIDPNCTEQELSAMLAIELAPRFHRKPIGACRT